MLLPSWMRFMKGVVDSEDITLNLSRELLQNTALINKIRETLTDRLIKFLNDRAKVVIKVLLFSLSLYLSANPKNIMNFIMNSKFSWPRVSHESRTLSGVKKFLSYFVTNLQN